MSRLASLLISTLLSASLNGQGTDDRPAYLLDYYGTSILPYVIPTDFSYITRFFACFEVGDDQVIVGTKVWTMPKHSVFTSARRDELRARYDRYHVWITWESGETTVFDIDHAKNYVYF